MAGCFSIDLGPWYFSTSLVDEFLSWNRVRMFMIFSLGLPLCMLAICVTYFTPRVWLFTGLIIKLLGWLIIIWGKWWPPSGCPNWSMTPDRQQLHRWNMRGVGQLGVKVLFSSEITCCSARKEGVGQLRDKVLVSSDIKFWPARR